MSNYLIIQRQTGNVTVFEAWEKSYLLDGAPAHAALRRIDGVWYGAVASRFLDASLDYANNEAEAVAAIIAAHPDLLRDGAAVREGRIEVNSP